MEWLINRRRMMFNKSVPPDYIEFEDAEVWRICCENWGDYNETVITDNGNNTVDIVTTFKSMLDNVVKKSNVVSTQTNVDNSGGTYTPGTTKEAVGITMKQCKAVTSTMSRLFEGNTLIDTFNEFRYFTGVTNISYFVFASSSIREVTFPSSLRSITGNYQFYTCHNITKLELPEGFTTLSSNQWVYSAIGLQLLIFPSTISTMNAYAMTKYKNTTYGTATIVIKATTPPTLSSNPAYNTSIGNIYVPDDSVDAYKTADKWSTVASKILPMSEYVES